MESHLFKEEMITSEVHTSYSVYKLTLEKRADFMDVREDWFDHISYGREVEARLKNIRPPQIAQFVKNALRTSNTQHYERQEENKDGGRDSSH